MSDEKQELIVSCGGDVWGSHPEHDRDRWRSEVWEECTNLGYWDWVLHQIEMEADFR